jgi:hypothetical protein
MKGRIYVSNKELSRVEILQKVSERKLKLAKAAKLLRVSVRQAKRTNCKP